MDVDRVSGMVVDAAIKVHRTLGPGLLESVYESVLEEELRRRLASVERQKSVPLRYEGRVLEDAFRVDLLVDGQVVVEVKAIEQLAPVHYRQVLTYLKLLDLRVGLLLNFGAATMREGLHRIVNGYAPPAPSASLREKPIRSPVNP